MSAMDKKTASALVKLVIFLVVTALATGVLAVVIGNMTFTDKNTYHAVFSDATSVVDGDDVRIAGVRVGNVTGVEVTETDQAEVTFAVDTDVTLTQSTVAALKYRNMIGQRYLTLSQGSEGGAAMLGDGDTIPLERTSPALDLTVLFNGFKPLFQALSPDDVNQLAYEVIQVFQGESGTVESLLTQTASLTKTLANRDKLIGNVIDNLTTVLKSFNDRDTELSSTILALQQTITGLKDDKDALTGSLDSIAGLADETSDLLVKARPDIVQDIAQLNALTVRLDTKQTKKTLDNTLKVMPIKLEKLAATSTYGSFFNFFVCDIGVNGRVPAIDGVPGYEKEQLFQTTSPVEVTGEGAKRCAR